MCSESPKHTAMPHRSLVWAFNSSPHITSEHIQKDCTVFEVSADDWRPKPNDESFILHAIQVFHLQGSAVLQQEIIQSQPMYLTTPRTFNMFNVTHDQELTLGLGARNIDVVKHGKVKTSCHSPVSRISTASDANAPCMQLMLP